MKERTWKPTKLSNPHPPPPQPVPGELETTLRFPTPVVFCDPFVIIKGPLVRLWTVYFNFFGVPKFFHRAGPEPTLSPTQKFCRLPSRFLFSYVMFFRTKVKGFFFSTVLLASDLGRRKWPVAENSPPMKRWADPSLSVLFFFGFWERFLFFVLHAPPGWSTPPVPCGLLIGIGGFPKLRVPSLAGDSLLCKRSLADFAYVYTCWLTAPLDIYFFRDHHVGENFFFSLGPFRSFYCSRS